MEATPLDKNWLLALSRSCSSRVCQSVPSFRSVERFAGKVKDHHWDSPQHGKLKGVLEHMTVLPLLFSVLLLQQLGDSG